MDAPSRLKRTSEVFMHIGRNFDLNTLQISREQLPDVSVVRASVAAHKDARKYLEVLVARVVDNSTLETFDLSGSDFSNPKVLSSLQGLSATNCQLKTLILQNCEITNQGLMNFIEALEGNYSIATLDFSTKDVPLTDNKNWGTGSAVQLLINRIKKGDFPGLEKVILPSYLGAELQAAMDQALHLRASVIFTRKDRTNSLPELNLKRAEYTENTVTKSQSARPAGGSSS